MTPFTHNDYTIAWICALPLEAAAAHVMLSSTHSALPQPSTDSNAYKLGELNGHCIVIACLPVGVYGTVSAATVVSRMRLTFPRLQYGLLVGIGGGVPGKNNDIRLGDVVVSKPAATHSGVIQYDYGKAVQGGRFESTGTLNKPPQAFLTHIGQLEAKEMANGENSLSKIVCETLEQNPSIQARFSPPDQDTDLLFYSSYHHANKKDTCEKCDKEQLIKRQPRSPERPYIHYGLIASGDQVMKDSETRDRLSQQHGILCFEMEAAGIMDDLPTLVIRGICDYCDSHKQKKWQGYAALAAAAYAKLLLLSIPISRPDTDLMNSSKKTRHWMVSLARNPTFVGRENEITELEELLTMRDGPRRVAITGLGGVGKTQIALELAYRTRDRDKECSIFWIPCTSHAMIEQMFLHLTQILELHGGGNPVEAKEKVKTYLSSERAGKWLLIFDNADDADMWLESNQTDPAVENFLPECEHGRILFTTRNRKLGMKLAPMKAFPIPDVDQNTAVKILERTLTNKDLLKDTTATTALLEELAFLPLAITQASAYVIENGIDLSTYLKLLQEQEQNAVELLSEDFRDPGRYKDIQNPVMTTWLISFKQIQDQNQLAADYLYFMACINPRNIPQSLLPEPSSRKQKIDALGVLNAYSFTNSQNMEIDMHRLVHIATRNWLRKNSLFSDWVQRVADHMENVFPEDEDHPANRGLWREYMPHALALLRENEFITHKEQYSGLIEDIANCLYSDGRYHEAEGLYSDLVKINQERNGPEHPDSLRVMYNLASIYRNQGRSNDSEKLEMQLMEVSKTVVGTKHPYSLLAMNSLVLIYQGQGRLDEAEKLGVQMVETSKTVLGAKHPSSLIAMNSLALIYQDQGRLNEAEKLEVQVIETRKTVLGVEHPYTLEAMANLAYIWKSQGKVQDASNLMEECSEWGRKVLGPDDPRTIAYSETLRVWMEELSIIESLQRFSSP